MRNLDRAYKYTRENANLISLTHVSREVADTLTFKLQKATIQDFMFGYIKDGCVLTSWGDSLDHVDSEGNIYMEAQPGSAPGEDQEITNFLYTAIDTDGDDPENLRKVSQQQVIFK